MDYHPIWESSDISSHLKVKAPLGWSAHFTFSCQPWNIMNITLLETSWNILKCFWSKFYSEKCILLDFLVDLHDKFQGIRELDDKKLKRRMDSVTQGCLSSHEQDILLKVQTTNKFVLLYLSCCNNWKP